VLPHVFVDATNDMSIAQEELFGPVVSLIKVQDEEEALAVANATSYGLSAAAVTRDLERGARLARRLQAGMTHVNDSPVNDLPNSLLAERRTPVWGGTTASGPSKNSPQLTGSVCNMSRYLIH
jgi:acyl-CoA reductase-like NAD-dependent aldehyde dehydrogenase